MVIAQLTDPNVYTFDMRQDPEMLAEQAREIMATIFPQLKGTFRGSGSSNGGINCLPSGQVTWMP